MIRKLFYIIGLFLLPLFGFSNDTAGTLFSQGNHLYAKGQFKEALAAYKQVVAQGYESTALYYNMGNASYKLDEIPAAILFYEKAHKISPGDEDINANLQLANSKTADKINEVPEFFLTRWWHGIVLAFSANTLSVLSITFFLLASGLLILYFYAESFGIKKSAFIASIALFVVGLFTIFVGNTQVNYFSEHKQAIVFSSTVTVKSGPMEKSNSLFVIHEGSKVSVEDTNNNWLKIKLANGAEGWIKYDDVKEI